MTHVSFIQGLKHAYPPKSWPWLISALRHDAVIWEALGSELGEVALAHAPDLPEDFNPGRLAWFAMGFEDGFERLTSLPMPEVDELETSPIESPLAEAGRAALRLRERRRLAGSWDGMHADLMNQPPTALACLFGMIPDPMGLLRTIIDVGGSSLHTQAEVELTLHVFLSQPLTKEFRFEFLNLLLNDLPASSGLLLLYRLANYHPDLAASLANGLRGKLQLDSRLRSWQADHALAELADLLIDTEVQVLSGQKQEAIDKLAKARVSVNRLEARLSARTARLHWENGNTELALQAWEEARQLDQRSQSHVIGLALALFESGRLDEGQKLLDAFQLDAKEPEALLARAYLAIHRRQENEAREHCTRALGLLKSHYHDQPASDVDYTGLAIRLANLLLDLNMPAKATEAALYASRFRPNDEEIHALTSRAACASGELDSAVLAAHLAVALAPSKPDLHRQLAECLELAGDWHSAYEERKSLVEVADPPLHEDLLALASAALHANHPEHAKQVCEQVLQQNDQDGVAHARLGEAYAALGDLQLASEYLHRAIQVSPEQPIPWLAMAGFHKRTNQPQKALEILRAATYAAPDSPDLHLALGESYLEQGALTQALHDLHLAGELADALLKETKPTPGYQLARLCQTIALRQGQTLHKLGHLEEATQTLAQAYHDAPCNTELAAVYAQVLMDQGHYRQALAPLETVLRTSPSDSDPYLDYARSLLNLWKQGERDVNVEDAIPALHRALELQPEHSESIALLGEALLACNQPEEAIETFNKALTSELVEDPLWRARLSLDLGKAALACGQVETAIAALREASQIDPLNPQVQRHLAEAYQANGLYEEAYQSACSALRLMPDDVATLLWFVDTIFDLQSHSGFLDPNSQEEVIAALKRVSQAAPTRADLVVRLGQAQMKIGDNENARMTLLRLAEEYGPNQCSHGTANDYYQAARGLIQLGDAPGAVACLERALQTGGNPQNSPQPNLLELLTALSEARYQAGDLQGAIQALDQAITIAPNEPNLYLLKANLLSDNEQSQRDQTTNGAIDGEVLHCLETAVKLNPDDPELHYRVTLIHRKAGNIPAAMAYAQRMLDVCKLSDPFSFQARALAAELSLAVLQSEQARNLLILQTIDSGIASENIPLQALDYFCLRAELALEDYQEHLALQELAKLIDIAPDHPRVLALQARLTYRRNEDQAALHLYNACLEAATSHQNITTTALIAIAQTGLELHQYDQALSLFARVAAQSPQEPFSHLSLARALVVRAEYKQLCEAMDVVRHAPGESALSTEAQKAFQRAIEEAERLSTRWAGAQIHGDGTHIARWRARGQAVFKQDASNSQDFASLSPDAEIAAAQIACLSRRGDLTTAGMLARDYPKHPLILLHLALALAESRPRQALAAAHASADALAEAQSQGSWRSAYRPKDFYPLIQALLARLFFRVGNRAGDLASAIQAIHNALVAWPDEPRWHILAAEIYLGRNSPTDPIDQQAAIEHLEEAIRLEPHHVPPYLKLGRIYLQTGSLNKAIQLYEYATRLAPDNPEAWLMLGQAYYQQSSYEQAEICAEQAIRLSPKQVAPLVLRGKIALEANQPQEALERAQSALLIDADDSDAMLLVAQALQALGRAEEALNLLEKAVQFVAQPLPLGLERIRLLKRIRGNQSALQAIQQLQEKFPNEPVILALSAEILAQMDDLEGAIRVGQRALKMNTETNRLSNKELARIHYLLGCLFHQVGQLDQAVYHLSEAIRLDADMIDAYLELGHTHLDRREHQQALNVYRQAITKAPQDYRPYYQIGLTLKDSKDYLGAEKMLRRAAELAPNDPAIHRLLAAVIALNLVHNHREAVPNF